MTSLSIIIPVLNEAAHIANALAALAPLRSRGAEVIVVDGGSIDGTADHAEPYADRVVRAERGRAAQMNAGAEEAQSDVLLFLHADTILPSGADRLIAEALRFPPARGVRTSPRWGRFDVVIEGRHPMLRIVATMMNWRSRLTGIATGDQAIFVERAAFVALGGFPVQPLMEDIEFCRRAKFLGWPACLTAKVVTSGRRWEKHGVWRTIWLMWRLRLAYFKGVDPHQLAIEYGYLPPPK